MLENIKERPKLKGDLETRARKGNIKYKYVNIVSYLINKCNIGLNKLSDIFNKDPRIIKLAKDNDYMSTEPYEEVILDILNIKHIYNLIYDLVYIEEEYINYKLYYKTLDKMHLIHVLDFHDFNYKTNNLIIKDDFNICVKIKRKYNLL